MSPPVAPPFPFYIINKDIIKGSFPFRKTFHTPKPDFATRFQPPRVFRRPEEPEQTTETEQTGGEGRSACRSPISQPDFDRLACSADLKSRNKTTETEQTGGEGRSACRSPISQPRFHNLDFNRLACSADLKSRNRTTETEQTGGEGKFSSPENTPIQRLFYLCPRRLQNPIPDITVRFVRKSAFKPPPAPLLPGKPADRKA